MFLEHVNMSVANLDRSIDYYRELLGLEVRWRGTTSDGLPAAHIGDERHYLALFEVGDVERKPADYGRLGLNHFGFVVDDLDACRAKLDDLGAPVEAPPAYNPGRRLYFDDPNGVEVELVEYAKAI
jgi:catechol 2,3-dioxygenase-like lactoylglutathione lyase family enzyme